MAKNIWYKIPFQSQLGIDYELRIYKEGTPTSVTTLKAGDVPFVTDEDDNNDFFTPVRTQTGNMSIIFEPSTQFPTVDVFMAALMPASNIDSPVELVTKTTSGGITTYTVVWQGFLNSESFSQNYISQAQSVTIPVISLLEAMDSVQVSQDAFSGLQSINTIIGRLFNEVMYDTGITTLISTYYRPTIANGGGIFSKLIDATALFEQKEYTNENSTTYIVSGLSCLEVLKRICQYMGWCCREEGQIVYIESANETTQLVQVNRQMGVGETILTATWTVVGSTPLPVVEDSMASDLVYRGDGHKMSINQGAKSVEVVAKVEKYNLNISIPACPTGDLATVYGRLYRWTGTGDEEYILANRIANAYSNITFANYSAMVRYWYFHFEQYATTTLAQVLDHMAVGANSVAYQEIRYGDATSMYRWYAGAFLARYCWEPTGGSAYHDVKDALYVVFFPHSLNYSSGSQYTDTDFDQSMVGPIFSIDNVINYRCNQGYLRLNASADTIYQWPAQGDEETAFLRHDEVDYEWFIAMELSVGSKWWNGSSWQSTQCTFKARFLKNNFKKNWADTMPIQETDGLLIPVDTELFGIVTLKIWPQASPMSFSESNTAVLEMIFQSLDLTHILPNDGTQSDRGENKYFRLLGTNFSDEKSINVDFASWLNNAPSPSLIMEDTDTPMTEINYGTSQSPDMRRPEVDLLNRLNTFYSLPRRVVKLEAEHPSSPLPALRLTGYDSKKYLPLAESRDWQADQSTITCMENPFPTA